MYSPISVDVNKFKEETGLEDDFDIKELYKGFLEELLEEREKLQVQLDEDNFEKMSRTVHNIKGISGSYMVDSVFNQSVELGRILSNSDKSGVSSAANRLIEAMMEAAGEIARFCEF